MAVEKFKPLMMSSLWIRPAVSRIFASDIARFAACLVCLSLSTQAFGQVTTYHYNNARTGATLGETTLTTSNVNAGGFGKLFSLAVDGQVYAQPLYLPGVAIPQKGVHNVLYVATEHNSVFAFDADSAGGPLWQVNLGPSMPWAACCMDQDLLPEIGVTSTPAIDPVAGTIYVVAETLENNAAVFRLHALDVTTGEDKTTPVVIQGSVSGNSFAASGGLLAFAPKQHYQRPALLLANGNIYVGFGGHQENTPFFGWLFSYNAATLTQNGIFCSAPDNQKNGIWQGGAGPAADAGGNIYLQTGDGPFDVNTGGRDYGDSVVKIGTSTGGLTVLDYFAPSTQLSDDLENWDLGSGAPLLIPGTALGVAGGKDGNIYVFNTGNLGHFNATDQVVQEWQATFSDSNQLTGGFYGGSYIFYNSTLYTFGERDSLKAFSFNGSQFNTIPTSESTFTVPAGTSNDPAISISANGATPGTGIVWAAFSADGVADGNPHPGIFYAFDASNVSRVLWNSGENSARDAVGNWAKWNPPVVANGKVYLGIYDDSVDVYGLLSAGQSSIAVTAGTSQSATVGATFATALQATVRDANNNPLSGVTVTFTAPASGPGATFSGSAAATATTNAGGVATAPALTANGQAGSYAVIATAPGVSASASFSLTNIAGAPAGIAVTAGSPQSAAINTGFATALQATVHDAYSNPVSNVTVTFTAPAGGASASFAGSNTAAVVSNLYGVATAPALTANGQTGAYAVTASAAGVPVPVAFNLTNVQGTPASISAAAGTPQSATVNTAFANALQATVKDAGNNPLSGVTVTFTAPATGATASFNGASTATAVTNSAGTATVAAPTAGGVAGAYTVSATVAGLGASAAFTLTNTAALVGGGVLTGSGTSSASTANLTTEGSSDWVHWGGTSLTRKSGVSAQIGNYTVAGSGPVLSYNNDPRALTWTDGSPTASGTDNNGIYIDYLQNGFSFTAPADTGARVLTVHVGGWMSGGTFTAHLSDLSAADFVDTTTLSGGQYDRNYTLTYHAASAGQTLTVSWVVTSGSGNVTLNGAALAGGAPATGVQTIAATAGTPQSATVGAAFATALQATVLSNSVPVSGVTVTFTAPASGAAATFNGSATATAVTNAGGVAVAPALTANSQAGSYTVTATVSGSSSSANFALTNTAPAGGGALTGSGTSSAATANLTSEGAADWVHWGDSPLTRKTGVTPQIGNYTVVGSGPVLSYSNDPRALTWTDGAPTASGTDNNGLYVNSLQNGFSFTAPADTGTRVLTVHVGGWMSGGTFTAHLSDLSAPDFVDATTLSGGQYDRNYTLIYNAASAGQTLTVSWVVTSGSGNVTLNGAALVGGATQSGVPTITATAGTPQSATVGTAFATALQATVLSNSVPVSGATVTFTAPASGAGAAFSGSTTATAVTNASGVATAPPLTANSQAGSYTVTAGVSGAASAAGFSLTNVAGTPASISAAAGTPQSATVNTAFANALQATVKDAGNNPLSGVTVTFTAPATGATASFNGASTATAVTNSAGTATVAAPTAGAVAGVYTVSATVAGLGASAAFTLTNTAALVGGGVLTGSGTSSAATANLTTEGSSDWVHWGGTSLIRKTGVSAQIANYTVVGSGPVLSYNNDPRALTWTDGSPTASGTDTNGIYVNYLQNGFSFTAPADTGARVLTVHVGGWMSGGTFTAHLSDLSAPDFVDTTTLSGGQYDRNYTLTYNAASAGQTLTVSWVVTSGSGNVTLNGAALAGSTIAATAGTPQSSIVGAVFAAGLQATVKDANNNPLSGVVVTFTAPATGPSAAFGGSATTTATTNASGVATAPAPTANGQAGSYAITATAAGVSGSAAFSLTNLGGAPAAIAPAGGTPQTTSINTVFAAPLQAMVTDAGNNPVSGAVVTFTAPATGAGASFSGSATATAVTNSAGVATAPALTANGQTGAYAVTAATAGVSVPVAFNLTNSAAPLAPISLVQQAQIDSMIDIQSESLGFPSPNTAGNWIGVAIFGGQSSTHQFTVTDSNGNTYRRALTMGNTDDNITLGMYYAENIAGGPNQVKVVPDTSGYIRVVIVEYSGVATSNSLDVTAAAQGNSVSPNSGTVTTTANGDLLFGASASADAAPTAGPGYTLEELVPASPGTALSTEDQIQTAAGPASASLTLGSAKDWTMGLAAFKRAQ